MRVSHEKNRKRKERRVRRSPLSSSKPKSATRGFKAQSFGVVPKQCQDRIGARSGRTTRHGKVTLRVQMMKVKAPW